ncbi:MAG: FAD-dependent monooxygenase [Pseudomonadota bacterium]
MSYDICILGAGMVGGAAALACANMGYKVALIDAHDIEPFSSDNPPDLRVSALNMHSVTLLKTLDVWSEVRAMRATAYTGLSCWEHEGFKTVFNASDIQAEQLGFFVENRVLQLALWQSCREHENIDLLIGHRPVDIDASEARVVLDDTTAIQSQIIIAADGAHSQARAASKIGVTGWQYAQCANLFTVSIDMGFSAETWQQFTPDGPLAFLPMHDNYACLVWYSDKATSDELMANANTQLTTKIKDTFPNCLNDFILLDKARFGLTRQHANAYSSDRVVLLGDAAHTINPLAGQGVNLGFKDVAAFADALRQHNLAQFKDIFTCYEQQRRPQNLLMMSAMDVIYATFSNRFKPLQLLRNIALKVADNSGPLKRQVLKYAIGLHK